MLTAHVAGSSSGDALADDELVAEKAQARQWSIDEDDSSDDEDDDGPPRSCELQ